MSNERQTKYWLCDKCAEKQKLVCFKTGNTVIIGLCGHCDREDETTLTPIVDFVEAKSMSEYRRFKLTKESR